jgi:DNA-binding NtrC family response regulator
MPAILCVEEEPTQSAILEEALARIGHKAVLTSTLQEALRNAQQEPFDLIISSCRLRDGSGLDLLDLLKQTGQEVPVIVTTAFSSVEQAVLTMRRGAVDYITKPFRFEALRIAVNNALEISRLRRENESYRREIGSLRGMRAIVGESPALRGMLETLLSVAPTRAAVLIEGESGTGKELLARAVHEQSPRAAFPFVAVNCAAMPEGLVESTLFGHERGSFTGANQRFVGAFERAHRGTLLLDEISELRLDLQPKLLRAMQEQEFERVGGSQMIRVDVRIVATSNRDLAAEVEAGRFRRDLYYRLRVVPVHTPPLRERLDDLPLLVSHFVKRCADELGIEPPEVPAATVDALSRYAWPGNIRELENAVERAIILWRGGPLRSEAFLPELACGRAIPPGSAPVAPESAAVRPGMDGSRTLNLREMERQAIARALVQTGGHRLKAAELLGISDRTLRNKLNGKPASMH